jgi:O-antigen/teichoic acid export membrane protein
VLRNIGSNWVLILVTVAATYVLTPFILGTLGQEGYGTWTLITAITGYIGLLALGVPMASVRYLAQHVAEGDVKKMNATIGSCAGLYLAIGGTSILVGGVLMGVFAFYEIPGPIEKEAHLAFALMVLHVSAGFIGLLPEGILFSHHAFVPRNVIRISGVLLRLGLTYLFLRVSSSLVLLALVQILCLAFDFGMTWLIVRRQYPDTRISLADFDFAVVRRIFSFSVYVLLLNAGARLVFETDALVIGAMLGVGAIPFYVVANSFAVYLMDFVIAIAAVVSPMATKLRTEQRSADLVEMFLKWSKVALSLTLVAGLFLIVFGSRFIGWWIDPSFERPSGQVLQILMVSSFLFLPVRGVAVPVLMGLGKPKTPAIASLAAGLLNLVMSLILVVPFGLVGVAVGTAIPNMIFAVVVLAVTCRELGITVADYVRYVVPRAFTGAMPLLVLLLWFRMGLQVQTLAGMAGAGTAMVLAFALIWVFYVYRRDPYVDLRPHFIRLRAWSRA